MYQTLKGLLLACVLSISSLSVYAQNKVVVIPMFGDELSQSSPSDTFLSGGGTFISDSSARLNTVIALSISNIDRDLLGTAQFPSGTVHLTSLNYDISSPSYSYQFRTVGSIDCLMLESYDAQSGDFELVLSFTKLAGSEIEMLTVPTSDAGPFTGTISSENDKSVGRLRRTNGLVTRSDWTTGYENCLGIGQPSLLLDGGGSIFQGSKTFAEHTSCSVFTPMPTCASFEPSGFNDGKLTPNRSLAGDIRFND